MKLHPMQERPVAAADVEESTGWAVAQEHHVGFELMSQGGCNAKKPQKDIALPPAGTAIIATNPKEALFEKTAALRNERSGILVLAAYASSRRLVKFPRLGGKRARIQPNVFAGRTPEE